MSEVLHASSFSQWKKVLKNIGKEGLVGAVLETEKFDPRNSNSIYTKAAIEVAKNDWLPDLPYASKFKRPYIEFIGNAITGAHVDVGSVPPLTIWGHLEGRTTWQLCGTDAQNTEELMQIFDEVTVPVSSKTAKHSQVFKDSTIGVSVDFTEPAIFCASVGIDTALNIRPAIHQVTPDKTTGRFDVGTNSLIFTIPSRII
jgi:hypothetical protein